VCCTSDEQLYPAPAPRPLMIVHGAENPLHRPEEAQRLYESAGEPELLEGHGHTGWMFHAHPTLYGWST
jgi:hypothetical protein